MTDPAPGGFDTDELLTAVLAGAAIEAEKLSQAAEHLAGTYRFSRQLKVILWSAVAMSAVLVSLVVLLLWVGFTNRSNGEAIRSCTTPGGDCYVRSQQATSTAIAEIVSEINAHTDKLLIATLQCSRHPLTDVQFTACLRTKGVR